MITLKTPFGSNFAVFQSQPAHEMMRETKV